MKLKLFNTIVLFDESHFDKSQLGLFGDIKNKPGMVLKPSAKDPRKKRWQKVTEEQTQQKRRPTIDELLAKVKSDKAKKKRRKRSNQSGDFTSDTQNARRNARMAKAHKNVFRNLNCSMEKIDRCFMPKSSI